MPVIPLAKNSMSIPDELIQFRSQFSFTPVVEQARRPRRYLLTVVGGMGGSQLGAGLLNAISPDFNLWVHKNYGLPPILDHLACETLFIASSYSGETEETLDFAREAHKKGYALAVVSSGGALTRFAETNNLPLVRLPRLGLPARMTVGLSALGILALLKEHSRTEELQLLHAMDLTQASEAGNRLAHTLGGKVPLMYASAENFPLAYFWKISCNETAKIPAFCNMLPEQNHNEIEGFTAETGVPIKVIMLTDSRDDGRIQKRMQITRELLERRGVSVSEVALTGSTAAEKIFGGVATGIAVSLALAKAQGQDPLPTPTIDSLKKRLA